MNYKNSTNKMVNKSFSEIKRTKRFEVWEMYCKKIAPAVVADKLQVKFAYVNKLYERWDGTRRMDVLKEKSKIYSVPNTEEVEKTLFEVLSEKKSFENSFVLLTNNYKVQEAYHKMLHNHNSDLPL